jgi:hypothetical protein
MRRGLAMLWLMLGLVFTITGFVGTVLALTLRGLPGGGIGILVGSLGVLGIGLVFLVIARILYRKIGYLENLATSASTTNAFPPNTPITRELDGTPYTILYTPPVKGKNARPSKLRISTPVDAPGEFHMAPETWFDRVCKNVGLATEIQTGDETFDRECYVRSDTPEFAAAYLSDSVKRIAVLDLRRLGFPEVILKERTIAATWSGFEPGYHGKPELPEETAARLLILARDLPADRPEFGNRIGARRKQWQVVLWVFLSLFGLTVLSLFAYPAISGLDMLGRALIVLLPGLPIFAYVAATLLRGTSTSHYAWGALMFGACILFPIGSFGTIGLVNGLFDQSAPVAHDQLIVEKYTSKSRNRKSYYVRCASWRAPGQIETFSVSSADYGQIVPHQSHLVATTRAGALGVEWLQSKQVKARPARP